MLGDTASNIQDGAGEAYRRNASADRKSLGTGGTIEVVEAGCHSPSLQKGRQARLLELSSHHGP